MPDYIRSEGKKCIATSVPADEYLPYLEYAMIEDLEKYLESKDPRTLADLLETIKAVASLRGLSWDDLETLREKMAADLGGYDEHTLLIWVEDPDLPRKRLLCTCERGDFIFEDE